MSRDINRPPISYYGGKQIMASKIAKLLPQHTVYVEPFCGGAAVMFGKPWPETDNCKHYREVLNDTDSRLINFYKQLQSNGQELCRILELTPYSEELHAESLREGLESGTDLERAVKYFVNISQSFSYILNGGWGRGRYSRNLANTWTRRVASLPDYIDRMSSVSISHCDALKCIKQWDSPQTLFYCDPPYPNTDQGHYSGYSLQDFQDLIHTLDKCQGNFVLSNYDQPEAKIPNEWERFEFNSRMSASFQTGKQGSNIKRTEVVWRRFNRVPVREEIQALYDSGKFDCFVKRPEDFDESLV